MKEEFEFDTIVELNRWFRSNLKLYLGYAVEQYKDDSKNKWVLSFVK